MTDTIRVLHVEDDPGFAERTRIYLEDSSDGEFTVETVHDASTGMERLSAGAFDCVISDHDIPGIDGLAFLDKVRDQYPHLPFLLFTGKGSEEIASRAISADVTDYLQKGGGETFEILANRIDIAVSKGQLQQFKAEMRQDPIALLDNLSDPLYALDTEWRYTYANKPAAEQFGRTQEELLGESIWELFPAAIETPFYEHYHAAMESREHRVIEEYFEPWDEWFREHLYPSKAGLTVISHDITEESEWKVELERIRDLFHESERLGDLGAWEFDGDTHFYWSDGTRRIHEVDDAYEPTLSAGIDYFHPDDRQLIEEKVSAALEDGEQYEVEARIITANGNERWVRTKGGPIDGGEMIRGFIQDITEEKEREQELQRARMQVEAAIEAGDVGTWDWDITVDELTVDPAMARTFGIEPTEADSGVPLHRFIERIHEDDRPAVEAAIQSALDTCGSYEKEYRVHDQAGDIRWVLARGEVECDQTGEPQHFPGTLIDITERIKREQDLKRQNERLEEFSSVVSHDLRAPLMVASGHLNLLADEVESEHIESIERAHERMDHLIEDLLTLARAGNVIGETEPVDVDDLLSTCWRELHHPDASLEADSIGRISADEDRLRQLIENLLRNAIEHGGEDVTVRVGPLDDGLFIEDDGPGIPLDEGDRIFEAGYSASTEGSGFGLSIVHAIVEAHGWDIAVTESEIGGARFEITGIEQPETSE